MRFGAFATLGALLACDPRSDSGAAAHAAPRTSASSPPALASAPARAFTPTKLERKETAMGTSVHFIVYSSPRADVARSEVAINEALAEMRRLEGLLSEWRSDSDVGRINLHAGEWVDVAPETGDVIGKALWAGKTSEGAFDITFQVMSDLWKFGSAADAEPKPPDAAEVRRRRALIDYRKVELDPKASRARVAAGRKIGLGGIAKGYIVDRAVAVLRRAGLSSFLVQAGGDLYGAGTKPDGGKWVSGIQDPRGPQGTFFAAIELEDHAFSTAGDYARAYVAGGRRYHHIIDPRTGYPATASRSVTVWAEDAVTADMVDDAVFILGPEKGMKIVDSLSGVGVVIVDAKNKVWVSERLRDKVRIDKSPSDGI